MDLFLEVAGPAVEAYLLLLHPLNHALVDHAGENRIILSSEQLVQLLLLDHGDLL